MDLENVDLNNDTKSEIETQWDFGKDLNGLEKVIYDRLVTPKPDLYLQRREMTDIRLFALQDLKELNIHVDENERGEIQVCLNHQHFSDIPHLMISRYAAQITYLDINYNNFMSLDFLKYFSNLVTLIADHNPVTSQTMLPFVPSLKTLWLNNCGINEMHRFVINLGHSCPNLEYLSIMLNPGRPSAYSYDDKKDYTDFRYFVVNKFPKLSILDDRPVLYKERQESNRLYNWTLLDIEIDKPSKLQEFLFKCRLFLRTKESQKRNVII